MGRGECGGIRRVGSEEWESPIKIKCNFSDMQLFSTLTVWVLHVLITPLSVFKKQCLAEQTMQTDLLC